MLIPEGNRITSCSFVVAFVVFVKLVCMPWRETSIQDVRVTSILRFMRLLEKEQNEVFIIDQLCV